MSTARPLAAAQPACYASPMTRPYGKIPRNGHKAQPMPSADLQINIGGRHTLEQFSRELSRAVARLQEHEVHGVQRVRIRLETLDEKGETIAAYSESGKPVQLIQIPDVPAPPPYRAE